MAAVANNGIGLALPLSARANLAHELLKSLDEGSDVDAEQAWVDEIARRLQEVDDGTVVLEDWDTVRARIAERLRAIKR